MFTSRKWSIGKCVCLAMLLLSLPAWSTQSASGVKWYAGLKLGDVQAKSLEGWRKALSQPWHLGNDPVSFLVSNGHSQIVVDRCDKLFSAVEGGMRAAGSDQAIFEGWAIKCHAVREVLGGVAPRKNFIGEFSLNEQQIRALPIGMAFVISPDDERRSAAIKSTGGSLGTFLGKVTVSALGEPSNRRKLVRTGSGALQLLSVLAEGDFDHDGINDLLISSNESLAGGSYHSAHLYVVSRLKAGAPLLLRRVVE